jgi:hypothetical protein
MRTSALFSLSLACMLAPITVFATALDKRADVTINAGTSYNTGTLPTLGLKWQGAGVLKHGCSARSNTGITDCYTYSLGSSTTSNLDSYGQQQLWFKTPVRTFTNAAATKYKYTWKNYVESSVTNPSSQYLNLFVIVSQGIADAWQEGDSIVRMDSRGGAAHTLGVYWYEMSDPEGTSTKWDTWKGRTTLNTLTYTTQTNTTSGSYHFVSKDAKTGTVLVDATQDGTFAIGDISIWFGISRNPVSSQKQYKAYFGDFTVQQLPI